MTIEFLEDIICTPTLLPSEHRASSQLLRMLTKEEPAQNRINLEEILTPIQVHFQICLDDLSFTFVSGPKQGEHFDPVSIGDRRTDDLS